MATTISLSSSSAACRVRILIFGSRLSTGRKSIDVGLLRSPPATALPPAAAPRGGRRVPQQGFHLRRITPTTWAVRRTAACCTRRAASARFSSSSSSSSSSPCSPTVFSLSSMYVDGALHSLSGRIRTATMSESTALFRFARPCTRSSSSSFTFSPSSPSAPSRVLTASMRRNASRQFIWLYRITPCTYSPSSTPRWISASDLYSG
mmetsp:Transcript_16332/g.63732  ORF Transcript_16332/g.63732 Transcript_16332/m.63732 type:complete len:206 (-) Transcript_16332:696-1313(-)